MAVTIRDVAALAGVSPATVSRTCNNNPAISAETREKVWQAINTLGYQVSPPAISNATSSATSTKAENMPYAIGIIMRPQEARGYDNPFVTRSIRGISEEAMKSGASSVIVSGESYMEILEHIKKLTFQRQVHGYVFLYSDTDDPIISFMHNNRIPFVVIGKANAYVSDTIYVDNDNLAAGQDAANYLIGLGHTKIAFTCDDLKQIFAYERNAGFRLAMMQHHLPVPDEYVLPGISMPLTKDSALAELLKSPNRPTALIIVDDTVALATLQLCAELGIRVPEDLSIITFNNSVMVKLSTPPLTTIDINSRRLGEEAAGQLIEQINAPQTTATKIIVPHYLVERKSCRAIEEASEAKLIR